MTGPPVINQTALSSCLAFPLNLNTKIKGDLLKRMLRICGYVVGFPVKCPEQSEQNFTVPTSVWPFKSLQKANSSSKHSHHKSHRKHHSIIQLCGGFSTSDGRANGFFDKNNKYRAIGQLDGSFDALKCLPTRSHTGILYVRVYFCVVFSARITIS